MTITPGFETRYRAGGYRTDGLLDHTGRLIVRNIIELQPDIFGKSDLILPPGTIVTADIAPNAVQQMIGQYVATLSWTLPTSSVWTETPIGTTGVVSQTGVDLRVEFSFPVVCTTKGQRIFWGVFVDGTFSGFALGALDAPENNYGMMATGTYYVLHPGAGSHRIAMGINGPSGSTIPSAVYCSFYVTEQKR